MGKPFICGFCLIAFFSGITIVIGNLLSHNRQYRFYRPALTIQTERIGEKKQIKVAQKVQKKKILAVTILQMKRNNSVRVCACVCV